MLGFALWVYIVRTLQALCTACMGCALHAWAVHCMHGLCTACMGCLPRGPWWPFCCPKHPKASSIMGASGRRAHPSKGPLVELIDTTHDLPAEHGCATPPAP